MPLVLLGGCPKATPINASLLQPIPVVRMVDEANGVFASGWRAYGRIENSRIVPAWVDEGWRAQDAAAMCRGVAVLAYQAETGTYAVSLASGDDTTTPIATLVGRTSGEVLLAPADDGVWLVDLHGHTLRHLGCPGEPEEKPFRYVSAEVACVDLSRTEGCGEDALDALEARGTHARVTAPKVGHVERGAVTWNYSIGLMPAESRIDIPERHASGEDLLVERRLAFANVTTRGGVPFEAHLDEGWVFELSHYAGSSYCHGHLVTLHGPPPPRITSVWSGRYYGQSSRRVVELRRHGDSWCISSDSTLGKLTQDLEFHGQPACYAWIGPGGDPHRVISTEESGDVFLRGFLTDGLVIQVPSAPGELRIHASQPAGVPDGSDLWAHLAPCDAHGR